MAAVDDSSAFSAKGWHVSRVRTFMGANVARCAAVWCVLAMIPAIATATPWDSRGYVVYCPCQGRFGNQVEYLLGALAYAKRVDRTLVVPPFIEYGPTRFVPFGEYFEMKALERFHRAVTMEEWVETLAPRHWKPEDRVAYCPAQDGLTECAMRRGNPSTLFWDHFAVTFARSELLPDPSARLDPAEHPVVALPGAPAPYPIDPADRSLQQYLRWNDTIRRAGDQFIAANLERPFVALHLRNGEDWARVCTTSAVGQTQFMDSAQCGHDGRATDTITRAACLPDVAEIIRSLDMVLERLPTVKTVFVGTDARDYRAEIQAHLDRRVGLGRSRVVRYPTDRPVLDLYVFGQADFFIGNCVSSFTAFAVRERSTKGKPAAFFGFHEWTARNSYAP